MPSLSWLILGRNRLTGTIPPELGGLSSLTLLYLDNNSLTGPIPPELAGLSGLLTLNLSNNELSGPIPPEPMHAILNDDITATYTTTRRPCIT